MKLNWRIIWYSVTISILVFLAGSMVILPWFYLTLPLVILWYTIFYFRRSEIMRLIGQKKIRPGGDRIFALGLGVSLVWFLIMIIFNLLELAGLYYFNISLYLLDPRNWFIFPLILLTPVIYSLVLENRRFGKHRHRKPKRAGFSNMLIWHALNARIF